MWGRTALLGGPRVKAARILTVLACLTIFYTVDAPAQETGHSLTKEDYNKVVSNPSDDVVFDAFLRKLPSLTVGTETKRTYYILEGDLLLTREQVRSSIQSYAKAPRPLLSSGELKVMMENGIPVFWPPENRLLTYAVDRRSFASQADYNTVVANMVAAQTAWVNVCPHECGLKIDHRAEFDDDPRLDAVTFVVTYSSNKTAFIASAFFPNDPLFKRFLIVGPSYFTTQFDKVGVLRHEIGHILGYRHEHISGVPGCYWEDNNWKALTSYDKRSVMHYFCGDGGTLELDLSDTDRAAHKALYRR
jgi:hypothetical protein